MSTSCTPNLGMDWPLAWARDFQRWTARLTAAEHSLRRPAPLFHLWVGRSLCSSRTETGLVAALHCARMHRAAMTTPRLKEMPT